MFQFKPAAENTFSSPQGPVFVPPRDTEPKCKKEIEASLQRLTEPQAATGGINWYRCADEDCSVPSIVLGRF